MPDLPANTSEVRELLCRLADGWRIEPPILQRSTSLDTNGARGGLEVVLCKDGERAVLALGDDPLVWEFLERQRLAILTV